MEFTEFAETTAFRRVAQTITALSTQDERIADQFRAMEAGRMSSGKIIEIDGDVPVGMKMKLADFAEAISIKIWENVGRVNWRPFEDARTFVRELGLKSAVEWTDYCKSGKKPADIPSSPEYIFANAGWAGWGDWLGTGTVSLHFRKYRSFKKARAFARGLGLKSGSEWKNFCKLANRPDDIPNAPHLLYADAGWAGWGDWLGTGNRRGGWLPWKKARAFVHRLGLKSVVEWVHYCRSGKKPDGRKPAPSCIVSV